MMNFGSPLDSVACCLMLVAGRPISQRISPALKFWPQLSQTRPEDILRRNLQSIAYSGVIPEPLLTRSLAIAL